MKLPRPRRYHPGAGVYDTLSMERALYRSGREEGIRQLALKRGDRVLDVGCGTGLSFPCLVDGVGTAGLVVGVDASAAMLREATARVERQGWRNVVLREGDAGRLAALVDGPYDAVLFAYALSVIPDWGSAWRQALDLVCVGGGVAVIDTAYPYGPGRVLAPLAAVAFAVGGVHPSRHVWDLVTRDTDAATRTARRGGHVQIAVGRRRAPSGAA